MAELEVTLGFGSMTYVPEADAAPEQLEKLGGDPHTSALSSGRGAYSEVAFYLSCKSGPKDDPLSNAIHWTVRIPGQLKADTPYARVENEAARQIAPMLRAVADEVEKLVAETDCAPEARGIRQ